jgi:hypothetical protein
VINIIKKCIFDKENRSKHLFSCVSFMTLASAAAILITLFFWTLYPYKPLVINNRPLPIEQKEIEMHETINYTLDYCKNMNIPVTIRRKLKDGIIFTLPEITTGVNTIGCRVETYALEVPHSLPAGEYIMIIEYVYQVNPIREVVVTTHTEKFEVL